MAKAAMMFMMAAGMLVILRASPLAMAGALLVVTGAVVVLVIDWTEHVAMSRLEFTMPASGFARQAIEKLRELRKPRVVHYTAVVIVPAVGVNLIAHGPLEGVAWRLLGHACVSLLSVVAAFTGFQVRSRRFRSDTQPLLERLEGFERSE